jgi:hypothetical protein
MKSAPPFLILLVLVFYAGMSNAQKQASLGPTSSARIANITDNNLVGGCGCYFQSVTESRRRSDKFIFVAGMEEEYAWMNIDGKDVKLTLTASSKSSVERAGMRSYERYRAANIGVRIDYVVTRVCKPNDEDCEATAYDATFSVTNHGRKRVIKSRGYCGC